MGIKSLHQLSFRECKFCFLCLLQDNTNHLYMTFVYMNQRLFFHIHLSQVLSVLHLEIFFSNHLHLTICLYSARQQLPIVNRLWPSLKVVSSASFTTKTSLAMYFCSSSVISQPAYLKPVYSMSSF